MIRRVFHNFPETTRGLDLVFESDLPSAAGMSSSSALMVAVLLALARVNRLEDTSRWREHGLDARENLAAYAATIENGSTFRGLVGEAGVGTEGGSEDHTAILCSRPGHLGQFSFVPTRHERYIPFPADVTFAIGVSGIAARKTGEARDDYNRASRNAARVLERWRENDGPVRQLACGRRPIVERRSGTPPFAGLRTTTRCSIDSNSSSRKARSS